MSYKIVSKWIYPDNGNAVAISDSDCLEAVAEGKKLWEENNPGKTASCFCLPLKNGNFQAMCSEREDPIRS